MSIRGFFCLYASKHSKFQIPDSKLMTRVFEIWNLKFEILRSTITHFRLELLQLYAQRLRSLAGSLFKRTRLLHSKKLTARHPEFYFNSLVIYALVVQTQKNFAIHEPIVKGFQLRNSLVDEIDQFAICIKMDGMNL